VKVFWASFSTGFFLVSMDVKKIWRDERQEVYMTREGGRPYTRIGYNGTYRPYDAGYLKPGEMLKVKHPFSTLNPYYDLSQIGEYEVTFYTRVFLADDEHQIGEYPKPCTVRFKIEGNTNWLDKQVVWPEDEE